MIVQVWDDVYFRIHLVQPKNRDELYPLMKYLMSEATVVWPLLHRHDHKNSPLKQRRSRKITKRSTQYFTSIISVTNILYNSRVTSVLGRKHCVSMARVHETTIEIYYLIKRSQHAKPSPQWPPVTAVKRILPNEPRAHFVQPCRGRGGGAANAGGAASRAEERPWTDRFERCIIILYIIIKHIDRTVHARITRCIVMYSVCTMGICPSSRSLGRRRTLVVHRTHSLSSDTNA